MIGAKNAAEDDNSDLLELPGAQGQDEDNKLDVCIKEEQGAKRNEQAVTQAIQVLLEAQNQGQSLQVNDQLKTILKAGHLTLKKAVYKTTETQTDNVMPVWCFDDGNSSSSPSRLTVGSGDEPQQSMDVSCPVNVPPVDLSSYNEFSVVQMQDLRDPQKKTIVMVQTPETLNTPEHKHTLRRIDSESIDDDDDKLLNIMLEAASTPQPSACSDRRVSPRDLPSPIQPDDTAPVPRGQGVISPMRPPNSADSSSHFDHDSGIWDIHSRDGFHSTRSSTRESTPIVSASVSVNEADVTDKECVPDQKSASAMVVSRKIFSVDDELQTVNLEYSHSSPIDLNPEEEDEDHEDEDINTFVDLCDLKILEECTRSSDSILGEKLFPSPCVTPEYEEQLEAINSSSLTLIDYDQPHTEDLPAGSTTSCTTVACVPPVKEVTDVILSSSPQPVSESSSNLPSHGSGETKRRSQLIYDGNITDTSSEDDDTDAVLHEYVTLMEKNAPPEDVVYDEKECDLPLQQFDQESTCVADGNHQLDTTCNSDYTQDKRYDSSSVPSLSQLLPPTEHSLSSSSNSDDELILQNVAAEGRGLDIDHLESEPLLSPSASPCVDQKVQPLFASADRKSISNPIAEAKTPRVEIHIDNDDKNHECKDNNVESGCTSNIISKGKNRMMRRQPNQGLTVALDSENSDGNAEKTKQATVLHYGVEQPVVDHRVRSQHPHGSYDKYARPYSYSSYSRSASPASPSSVDYDSNLSSPSSAQYRPMHMATRSGMFDPGLNVVDHWDSTPYASSDRFFTASADSSYALDSSEDMSVAGRADDLYPVPEFAKYPDWMSKLPLRLQCIPLTCLAIPGENDYFV